MTRIDPWGTPFFFFSFPVRSEEIAWLPDPDMRFVLFWCATRGNKTFISFSALRGLFGRKAGTFFWFLSVWLCVSCDGITHGKLVLVGEWCIFLWGQDPATRHTSHNKCVFDVHNLPSISPLRCSTFPSRTIDLVQSRRSRVSFNSP